MSRRALLVVAAVVLAIAPASGATGRRNVVVYGTGGGPITGFNSVVQSAPGSVLFADTTVLRGPFRETTAGTWVKDLVSSAYATRRGVTYTISPKAFWYWGGRKVPVTYKDFVYSLQQIDDPKNVTSPTLGNLDPTRFVHHGLRQVTFYWRTSGCSLNYPCGPVAAWQGLFSQAGNSFIYPSFALKGEDFTKIWPNCICGSDGKPVSDGPFYLASYSPGQELVFKRNPFWGGRKPGLAEIRLRFFSDSSVTLDAMRQGVLDLIGDRLGPDVLLFKNTPGIAISTQPLYDYETLDFREGNSPGADTVTKGASNGLLRAPWMREAIALGIDRRAIIRAYFGVLSNKVHRDDNALFYPTQATYRTDFAKWNYNQRKALQILKAHCARGTGPTSPRADNDKVWRCDGAPATFRWVWPASNPIRTEAEQIAKADLKAIGIGVIDMPAPSRSFFDVIGSGDYDVTEFGWNTTGDPGDFAGGFHCRGPQNWTGFCSKKIDALLDAGSAELNPSKRVVDLQQADALIAASVPALPLYQVPAVWIHKSKLVGVAGPPEDWHWKP